jgi:tripartite-type tricarboxylate transporter receptor subunit TctC
MTIAGARGRQALPVLAVMLMLVAGGAFAQQPVPYPNRVIRMIIPFAPGGASDFVGRIVGASLGPLLGQQIVADNRGGASGNIGMEAAAKAAPDGYTIFQGNVGTLAINPGIFPALSIKPLRDFIPVSQVVDVPDILVVHPSVPVKSVKELIAFARARPGQVPFASPGAGTAGRLEVEYLAQQAGLNLIHVPYKGRAGPAVVGLLGGETALTSTTISSVIAFVKAGRLRPLGIVFSRRLPALPDTPTMQEQGFNLTAGSWQGVLVPARTPKESVDKLYAAVMKTMEQPEVRKRLADGAVEIVTSASPAEFGKLIARETQRWEKVIKEANIVAD